MPPQITAGTVVYAKDLARLSAFYAAVTGLPVTESEQDSVVLESAAFQLVVVQIPAHLAASIEVAVPPDRREDTALKPVFFVPSITAVRAAVADLGGELDPPACEWRFQRWLVCDGHDPEGSVIQVREVAS
ncbi:MAG: VOC family protein [Actinomycetes bacterium]